MLSRPNFEQFATRSWDAVAAEWKQVMTSGSGTGSSVTHTEQFSAPDLDQAQRKSGSNAAESVRDRGGADNVIIDGEPAAQPTAQCAVSGIRTGVDGTYTIRSVKHRLTRSNGFTTELSLVQPSGTAGVDTRTPAAAAGVVTGTTTPGSGAAGSSTPANKTPSVGGVTAATGTPSK